MKFCQISLICFDLSRIFYVASLKSNDKSAKNLAIFFFTRHSLQSTHVINNVGMRYSFFDINEHEGSFKHVNN